LQATACSQVFVRSRFISSPPERFFSRNFRAPQNDDFIPSPAFISLRTKVCKSEHCGMSRPAIFADFYRPLFASFRGKSNRRAHRRANNPSFDSL
jgi:hypothetical protein